LRGWRFLSFGIPDRPYFKYQASSAARPRQQCHDHPAATSKNGSSAAPTPPRPLQAIR
jgi:hypothetical protein